MQYLRAPQGNLTSGDAYWYQRYEDIISDILNRIVDDVFLYDKGIEEAFYHVFDYLYLCGENGITLFTLKSLPSMLTLLVII